MSRRSRIQAVDVTVITRQAHGRWRLVGRGQKAAILGAYPAEPWQLHLCSGPDNLKLADR